MSVEVKIKDVLKVEGKKAVVTLYENPFAQPGEGSPEIRVPWMAQIFWRSLPIAPKRMWGPCST